MSREQYFPRLFFAELAVIAVALVFLAPFYFVLANSVKPFGAIVANAASFPETFHYQNYLAAWEDVRFPVVLMNSVIVSTFSIGGMVMLGAMAAWRMVRRPHFVSRAIFILFVAAMVIPFQSVMIPMVKVAKVLGIINSRVGVIIIYFGFGLPLTVFLLHGFVKGVPRELEESAYIDGCTTWQSFFHVVLPMMRVMIVTVIILQALWIWNDFLLPALVLFSRDLQTIPLGIFRFFGQHMDRWDLALATLTMGMFPVIVLFLFLQKYIIRGVAAGSVKG
ncbi:MAG: ABC transporter permease subunit [Spirochaetes bacterium]|jgi:raffinose/stachyose/melibiose transport system permease protein|nr:ABC transporter permease subunit [Spirochaetota bacterium]